MSKKRLTSWHWQEMTSTISTTMVLVLLGLVVLFVLSAKELGDSVRENLTLTIVLEDDVPTPEAANLQSQLRTKRYVNDIEYISREQALKEQVESMGIDPTDFLGSNPFSISMELKVRADYSCNDSLEWIAKDLKSHKLIADVMYQKELVDSINENLKRVSLILLVIAGLLVIVSLSLINNTVRLNVYSHRFIIHTMKLVGAKWGFIRRPFMWRSLWVGIISAILADGLLFAGIEWAYRYDEAVRQYVTMRNNAIMALAVLAVGMTITLLCTYLSVTHYLRQRESELY